MGAMVMTMGTAAWDGLALRTLELVVWMQVTLTVIVGRWPGLAPGVHPAAAQDNCNPAASALWDPLFGEIGGLGNSAITNGFKLLAGALVVGLVSWLFGAAFGRGWAFKAGAAICIILFVFGVAIPHWQTTYGCTL